MWDNIHPASEDEQRNERIPPVNRRRRPQSGWQQREAEFPAEDMEAVGRARFLRAELDSLEERRRRDGMEIGEDRDQQGTERAWYPGAGNFNLQKDTNTRRCLMPAYALCSPMNCSLANCFF